MRSQDSRQIVKGEVPVGSLGSQGLGSLGLGAGGDLHRRSLPPACGRGRRSVPWESDRGVEKWYLVGLITRRSQVRILPPLPPTPAQSPEPAFFVAAPLVSYPAPRSSPIDWRVPSARRCGTPRRTGSRCNPSPLGLGGAAMGDRPRSATTLATRTDMWQSDRVGRGGTPVTASKAGFGGPSRSDRRSSGRPLAGAASALGPTAGSGPRRRRFGTRIHGPWCSPRPAPSARRRPCCSPAAPPRAASPRGPVRPRGAGRRDNGVRFALPACPAESVPVGSTRVLRPHPTRGRRRLHPLRLSL